MNPFKLCTERTCNVLGVFCHIIDLGTDSLLVVVNTGVVIGCQVV